CFTACLSLYKCCSARVLQGRCGLDGSGELPLSRRGFLLDYFWNCTADGPEYELSSDRGIAVRCCRNSRILRGFQRRLDADHANDGAARELAGSVAGANRGADQRCAPWARAKRQFPAALDCDDV